MLVPALYLPAAHLRHLDVLALGAIVPGAQGICAALPVTAKKPGSVRLRLRLRVGVRVGVGVGVRVRVWN